MQPVKSPDLRPDLSLGEVAVSHTDRMENLIRKNRAWEEEMIRDLLGPLPRISHQFSMGKFRLVAKTFR